MAKKRPSIRGQALRSFRHDVAVLKSKGLMSKRVDARSQAPTKYMRAKVKKLAPVLTGQAVGIKLKPSVLKQYREAGGYYTTGGRVVLPKDVAELPGVRRGLPMLRMPLADGAEAERIPLPFGPNNMAQIIEDMLAHPAKYNALKAPGEYFTFKVYGHFSKEPQDNIEWLAEYLNRYDASIFEGFELFRMTWATVTPRYKEPRRSTKTVQDRRLATNVLRAREVDARTYAEKRSDWDKKRLAQIKNDPVKLAKLRDQERARSARYRYRKGALK